MRIAKPSRSALALVAPAPPVPPGNVVYARWVGVARAATYSNMRARGAVESKEGVMRALPTKQSSVLGLPIGRRRTDWALVGKLGAVGLGAVSTAVGGVAAKRAGGRLKEQVGEQAQKGKETMEKVGKAADRASSLAESVSGPV
jgi:hypothetical protein